MSKSVSLGLTNHQFDKTNLLTQIDGLTNKGGLWVMGAGEPVKVLWDEFTEEREQ